MNIAKDNFSTEEILQFYKVIEISEKELKENQGGFKMDEGRVKKFKDNNQIVLKKVKTPSDIIKHEDLNRFLFTYNRKSQGASFIAHVQMLIAIRTFL